ncbi:hypothetical protein GCM10017607_19030 [Microbacterium thalassium]|nr:hypothetical protein GCM10017607_19030 [Microbacterium thalassium]
MQSELTGESTAIPLTVRLHLGRAAIQIVADEIGADLLHIKGDAVETEFRPTGLAGTDVDVLVRPQSVGAVDAALRAHGWSVYSTFLFGSPFGHAQTYSHPVWGYVDIHRIFPGIRADPAAAFERMWRGRLEKSFGGVACPTPGRVEQALILVLNAARSGTSAARDLHRVWRSSSHEQQQAIRALARDLDAGTAFAAAIGELDDHRREPDYRLWKAVSQGGTRAEEWWGRLRAAPTARDAAAILVRSLQVNVEHLTHELGRTPTRTEIAREFFARPARGIRELVRRAVP